MEEAREEKRRKREEAGREREREDNERKKIALKKTRKTLTNRKVGAVAVRLLLFPGIIEALVTGGVMIGVFGMPPLFAIAVGFVIKP